MAAIGSVWDAGTWTDDIWALGTWGDAEEPPVPAPTDTPSGGFADYGTLGERRRKKKYPEAVEEILEQVAERQVETLEANAQKQKRELQQALRLRGLKYETKYLEDLADKREALIVAEIAKQQEYIAAHNLNAAEAIRFIEELDTRATIEALQEALAYLTKH